MSKGVFPTIRSDGILLPNPPPILKIKVAQYHQNASGPFTIHLNVVVLQFPAQRVDRSPTVQEKSWGVFGPFILLELHGFQSTSTDHIIVAYASHRNME